MARQMSAGLLVFRRRAGALEFLLVHPGGPFWRSKDEGAWSIPKGLIEAGEDELSGALREFKEETGLTATGDFTRLANRKQKSGKIVACWLVEADLDLAGFRSNVFELAWPKGSGRTQLVPECDQGAYFAADAALKKILPGQRGFIEEALERLDPRNATLS
jgi:predicted NUDIX family NTP pyrophosphohydrolase